MNSNNQICLFQTENGYCCGKLCEQYSQCFPSDDPEKILPSASDKTENDLCYAAKNISNSVVIQANHAQKIIFVANINDGQKQEMRLTEDETELFTIYRALHVKARTALLNAAYELAEDPINNHSFAQSTDNNADK